MSLCANCEERVPGDNEQNEDPVQFTTWKTKVVFTFCDKYCKDSWVLEHCWHCGGELDQLDYDHFKCQKCGLKIMQ